ncbi:MAG: sulfurtransferase TusA family protein, partial [Streptomyces sp.]
SCLYVDGEALLHALDRAGFSVSSGSSCTSSTLTPSHVLRAMGVLSEGNIRVSLTPGAGAPGSAASVEEDVEHFLTVLPEAVRGVREQLGAPRAPGEPRRPVPPSADLTVDALGTLCPVPVIELAKVIHEVPVGGVITVLADDEAARLDIPAWCEMRGQEYLGAEGTSFRVRRRA